MSGTGKTTFISVPPILSSENAHILPLPDPLDQPGSCRKNHPLHPLHRHPSYPLIQEGTSLISEDHEGVQAGPKWGDPDGTEPVPQSARVYCEAD